MLSWFTPLRLKLVGAIAGGALLLWFGFYVRSTWIEEGKSQEREQAAVETKPQVEQAQELLLQRLTAAETLEQQARAREAAAAERERQAAVREAQAAQNLLRLALEQREARAAAERVPDEGLVGSIRQKLALTPNDLAGTLNPTELREVNATLAELPKIEGRLEELQNKIAAAEAKTNEVRTQLTAVGEQLSAVRQERDAAFAWADTLHVSYVTAYNAAMQPKRKWYCLWLCTKKKSIQAPTPDQLLQNRPGKTGG